MRHKSMISFQGHITSIKYRWMHHYKAIMHSPGKKELQHLLEFPRFLLNECWPC